MAQTASNTGPNEAPASLFPVAAIVIPIVMSVCVLVMLAVYAVKGLYLPAPSQADIQLTGSSSAPTNVRVEVDVNMMKCPMTGLGYSIE